MISLANRGNVLGQMNPFINPALNVLPTSPTVSTPAAGGGDKALLIGFSLITAAMMGVSTVFTYGLARDSRSKMVRTSGYILAGASALGTLAYLIGGPTLAMLSGKKQ